MENKICFLVSSAVVTKYGDAQKRALMTINTISSINANCPGAKIVLLECGQEPIPQEYLDHFPPNVGIIPYWTDNKIQHILKEATVYREAMASKYDEASLDLLELGYVKSRTETYVFNDFLKRFDFEDIDFVFKLSGRYCLTPRFKLNDWLVDGKICFNQVKDSPFQNIKERKHDKMYTTWLWGFSTKILDEVRTAYGENINFLLKTWLTGGVCDIEHSLWNVIPKDIVHILDYEKGELGVLCFEMGGLPNNNQLL